MKSTLETSAAVGAGVAFVASLLELWIGPKDILGWAPEGPVVEIIFWPGIVVGKYAGEHLGCPILACWAIGIFAMTLLGAVIGTLAGLFIRDG